MNSKGNRIRGFALVVVLAVLGLGCAHSPKTEPTVTVPTNKAYLIYTGPQAEQRIQPSEIFFTAKIIGAPLQWCPEQVIWNFGDGAIPSRETRTVGCLETLFTNHAIFGCGTYQVHFTLISNGQVAGHIWKPVIINCGGGLGQ